MGKHRKSKQPTEIKFDKNHRKEFLTGFSKRKKQRQEYARKELETQIKEEKQKMKAEIRNARNMTLHNDVVQSRLKQLRNLEGLQDKSEVAEEADGRVVETCEINMTADLTDLAASKNSEAKKSSPEKGTEEEPTLLSIDSEANRKADADKAEHSAISRTKQKKLQAKAGQLQKLANVATKGRISAKNGNKKALHQRANNRTMSKRNKHKSKAGGKTVGGRT